MTPWNRAVLVTAPVVVAAVFLAVSGHWDAVVERRMDRLERIIFGHGMSRPWSWVQHTAVAVVLSLLAGLASWSTEGVLLAATLVATAYALREIHNLLVGAPWWDCLMDVVGPWGAAALAWSFLA